MRDDDLPENWQETADDEFDAALRGDDDPAAQRNSLTDDILALVDDGKTYAEAELAFQKSRAAFVANRGKSAALFGIFAFSLVHLALVALVVGAVIALAPSIGAWPATALVVGLLLAGAVLLLVLMRRHTMAIGDAFAGEER